MIDLEVVEVDTERKLLWEIMIPCKWNSGRPIHTRHHKAWDKRVRAIAGGLTILSVGLGQWVNTDGEEFLERVIPVRIMCSTDEMRLIADITIEHYEQEAVFFYVVSDNVGPHYATPEQRAKFTGVHQDND